MFRWVFLLALPAAAQAPRAILADGDGPWRDGRWTLAVAEFGTLLNDAGFSVTTVSLVDLPSALGSADLLAIPSLESLPLDTMKAVAAYLNAGGNLMASGGEPFRNPLSLSAGGQWAASQQPFINDSIETLYPAKKQYTNSAGLRVPIARGRGLSAMPDDQGRYRVIGDLLAPAATIFLNGIPYFQNGQRISPGIVVWLPWPQLFDPLRGQLVTALHAARHGLFLLSAGPEQIAWLPGEDVTGRANVLNASGVTNQAVLQWSISGASGATAKPPAALSVGPGELHSVPLDIGNLSSGDYTLTFRLMAGDEEVDRIDSPLRVFDPTLSRQPDQKIRVVNGSFFAGGRQVFLRGVNYWPRYIAGLDGYRVNGRIWFAPQDYDPDIIEADLSEIEALGFNLVNIQYGDLRSNFGLTTVLLQEGRSLMDFLERCRRHGLWVRIALQTTLVNAAYTGMLNPVLGAYLQAADLPGNDRVFAYELLWEPMIGSHDQGGQGGYVNGQFAYNLGRLLLDPDWRTWVNDQYGSLANAEQIWGLTAPRDANGQLTNPLDDQITSDGPWRIMVAAYRRFLEDYLGRNLGVFAREIRRNDPDTLLTYRNWVTMTPEHNFSTGYDIGTGAAHLDFFSPERYAPVLPWPDDRSYGLVTAYSRYRTGGKPVQWTEFGSDVGPDGGTPDSRAAQASICDTMMRQVADDGSNAASVWWWPGGYRPQDGTDFGIIDPDGAPRDCARVLAQWNATFAAAPPDLKSDPPTTLIVDRDADARGSYGLFLKLQDSYVQARQAGESVALADAGAGTDTSTMPLLQVDNAPYAGSGPLKFVNAEFAGIRIACPNLDVTVENGASVAVPAGTACQVTPTLVNTGEARWLAGGVILHTNAGDAPLTAALPPLERSVMGPIAVNMGQNPINLTGRLRIQGVGDFGEVLNVTLAVDSAATGSCPISLSSATSITAPAAGASGTINLTTAAGCAWKASSQQPWVAVSPAAGTGSGAVSYVIQPNTGPVRQAAISVAAHPFTVTQAALPDRPVTQIAVSAANLSFGNLAVGVAGAAQSITLTNTGATALNLSTVSIGGTNSADFTATSTCAPVVAVSASCTVSVSFKPVAAGSRAATLFVSGNISNAPAAVSLSGTGAATGPVPTIQAIVDSWGYTAGIAPGLWVTIGGTNLAGPPQTWNLNGGQRLPTSLGGVTVTFNGTPAALLYVSATQIDALVPASTVPGPVQVAAEVNGVSSVPFTITAQAAQPAVYAPPSTDGSTFFVTAALAGTSTLIGNSVTDPRVSRAALPGDILDLYMIGLGATVDPTKFVTDQVFSGASPVSAKVAAVVGGEPAPVTFAGLTSPGLYLVRITVPPDLAAGPQPIQISAGASSTRPSLVLVMGAAPR